jgi:hypothetical protein
VINLRLKILHPLGGSVVNGVFDVEYLAVTTIGNCLQSEMIDHMVQKRFSGADINVLNSTKTDKLFVFESITIDMWQDICLAI